MLGFDVFPSQTFLRCLSRTAGAAVYRLQHAPPRPICPSPTLVCVTPYTEVTNYGPSNNRQWKRPGCTRLTPPERPPFYEYCFCFAETLSLSLCRSSTRGSSIDWITFRWEYYLVWHTARLAPECSVRETQCVYWLLLHSTLVRP